ncbi:PTS sugar transporter subunit IIC [Clostridium sp. 'deep sea']|uniref:PTS transporter subunit IIC n=1 Tax=Clostridium sp. 'deep sea' TaxID=2779445 RepID=UPI0018966B0A|nr:PTS sugar transporter subunit IIC [Clostridium sp. 'deep sea']QOR33836.1 PTS sugar transporter subunit IIC [Clostridium sp. 'deep sea']
MEKKQVKQGFFKRKNIEFTVQRYLIDALSYMALGLFSSLIIGSILNVIGGKLGITFLTDTVWPLAKQMTGPAIAVAVAYGLQAPPLVLFASAITGAAGGAAGGPVGAFLAGAFGAEFGKMVSKETKIDIIVTPAVTIIVGCLVGTLVGPGVDAIMSGFGTLIMRATEMHPIPMGIIIAVLMGMALTLPISSASIGIMLSLSGIAAGAATVGCAAQMVGFAVMSFKENGWGGLFAQGLGTSMLQMPNIVKNWKVWIPPTLAGAIIGPLATTVFKMQNIPIGSGMGTSGLVGQFGTVTAMEAAGLGGVKMYLAIILLHFILPAVITLLIAGFMRKKNMIKENDLKLEL